MLRRFEHYVLFDHHTRWVNDSTAFVFALAWWAVRAFYLGAPNDRAFAESLIVAVTWVGITTLSYCLSPIEEKQKLKTKIGMAYPVQRLMPRLTLIGVAVTLIGCTSLGLPTIEAKILDSRLTNTLAGPLTPDTIGKAQEIVQTAQQYNLHANPILVSQLGKQILDSTAENPQLARSGLQAASAFASFRSNLNPLFIPKEVEVNNTVWGLYLAITNIGQNSDDPAIWTRPGDSLFKNEPRFHRVIFRIIHEPGQIVIDNSHIRNITFVNANILYMGGPLKLESVEFVRCHFLIPVTNDNTRRLITDALGGGPVTFEIKQ
jgi:hypothetical protein